MPEHCQAKATAEVSEKKIQVYLINMTNTDYTYTNECWSSMVIGHFHVNLKKKKAVEYPVISWVMSTSSRIYNPASLPRMLVTVL